jgi:DNA-binding response OmpR family regulator
MQRILVIDDDKVVRELLKDFFETKDFEVVTASEGESGLNLLKEDKFDLLLLDHMLPGIDGLDVLREIASEKRYPVDNDLAYASVSTAVEAINSNDYITKPLCEDVYLTARRALMFQTQEKITGSEGTEKEFSTIR